jgi:predicted solute-binding protein
MRGLKAIAVAVLLGAISACATIPQESVGLSNELGVGIKKQHQAQVNFLNLYFESKRKNLDAELQRAIAFYFSTLAPSGSFTLTAVQLSNVAEDALKLNEKNNAAKRELEIVRVDLVSKLEDNYLTLNQANSMIGLLPVS